MPGTKRIWTSGSVWAAGSERRKAPWSQKVVERIPLPPSAHLARARGEMMFV